MVSFFRGRWCPYCVTELETWRDLHATLRRRGALFVAISPQTPRQNDFTLQQLGLPFPILSDAGAQVAQSFGIAYTVPPAHRRYFQSILVNIPFANAGLNYHTATEPSWRLPLPATFVLQPARRRAELQPSPLPAEVQAAGTIAFAEAHADSRVRPEPADVLAAL